jgi:hypothetical protein
LVRRTSSSGLLIDHYQTCGFIRCSLSSKRNGAEAARNGRPVRVVKFVCGERFLCGPSAKMSPQGMIAHRPRCENPYSTVLVFHHTLFISCLSQDQVGRPLRPRFIHPFGSILLIQTISGGSHTLNRHLEFGCGNKNTAKPENITSTEPGDWNWRARFHWLSGRLSDWQRQRC